MATFLGIRPWRDTLSEIRLLGLSMLRVFLPVKTRYRNEMDAGHGGGVCNRGEATTPLAVFLTRTHKHIETLPERNCDLARDHGRCWSTRNTVSACPFCGGHHYVLLRHVKVLFPWWTAQRGRKGPASRLVPRCAQGNPPAFPRASLCSWSHIPGYNPVQRRAGPIVPSAHDSRVNERGGQCLSPGRWSPNFHSRCCVAPTRAVFESNPCQTWLLFYSFQALKVLI